MSEPQEPSLEELRAMSTGMGLNIPDADLERLRPEVESLRRQAERLRQLPLDVSMLPTRERSP